jgi:hypothetical protein
MNTNPSDRAMKCASVVYDHFISFPIRRQDDHQAAIRDVARIIDRHFSATPLNTTSETTTKQNTNLTKGRDENE